MSEEKIKVLVVGAGNMGRSHALAFASIPEFEIAAVCTRSPESRAKLMSELPEGTLGVNDYENALNELKPDAVCISTYPDTHYPFAKMALEAGCHVFTEKPLAENTEQCKELVDLAKLKGKALVVGYILRQHPSWIKFVEVAKTLGKPLVMRMNLNQQSYGKNWETHKSLLSSISPIVDCGVHYVDVMCQMTGSKPTRVSGLGAQLTDELPKNKINYGHLQVTFEDGSVGWYEAGWGPMMSETAFFVKDVVGPLGSASIVATDASSRGQSSSVDAHTQTERILLHRSQTNEKGELEAIDEFIELDDEPDHDELCRREQLFFLQGILGKQDLSEHQESAIRASEIVLAADHSFRTGEMIRLPG
ncbi:MAG: Gfo/Idh/MocA family oxidoreductase [Verrucomicrobiota bacterium]|nr:Gfo/Idh/MocA family oxidoreductase [Verrucomicrobiota bacterium]